MRHPIITVRTASVFSWAELGECQISVQRVNPFVVWYELVAYMADPVVFEIVDGAQDVLQFVFV